MIIEPIAKIHTPFCEKFGIPRQSGLAKDVPGEIVFEEKYSDIRAVKELEEYERIWLIWGFDAARPDESFRPTVRPPRLGGNEYVGVFATRSPFRPNRLGLSCVRLCHVEEHEGRVVLKVSGVDMLDGTPIYDIKPYLPYVDSFPDAGNGIAEKTKDYSLEVTDPDEKLKELPDETAHEITECLSRDPRPSYQQEPERIYGMKYGKYDVKFKVADKVRIVEIDENR